jgi:hypothetical protein
MHLWCDLGADRGAGRGARQRRLPVHVRANPRNLESVAHPAISTLESGGREGLTLRDKSLQGRTRLSFQVLALRSSLADDGDGQGAQRTQRT